MRDRAYVSKCMRYVSSPQVAYIYDEYRCLNRVGVVGRPRPNETDMCGCGIWMCRYRDSNAPELGRMHIVAMHLYPLLSYNCQDAEEQHYCARTS